MVLAGSCPKGGSNDKQQDTAKRQTARSELPLIGGGVLFGDLHFKFGDPGLVLRGEIGRWIGEKQACAGRQRAATKAAQKDEEMFHGVSGLGLQGGAVQMPAPPVDSVPAAALVEELAGVTVHPRRRDEVT
jgi:hypothetical protein